MEFRVLGPLEAVAEGRVVALDAAKPRALLAILLLHANEPVASDRLIEDLWAGRPPATAAKVLQTYVSQLRKALGNDVIVTRPAGYELRVEPDGLDLHRFERLVTEARGAEPPAAAQSLREALALWRGPPLAEFAYEPWAQGEIGRLEELHLSALQDRIDADLALGRARRARRRARAPGRRAPAVGAPARPADARALPLGQAGGGTGRLPGGAGDAGGDSSGSSRGRRCAASSGRSSIRIRTLDVASAAR